MNTYRLIIAAILLTFSSTAYADQFVPADCPKEDYSTQVTTLPVIDGVAPEVVVHTCWAMGEYLETLITVRRGDQPPQEIFNSMGTSRAQGYTFSTDGKTLTAKFGCASRHDDEGQHCTLVWEWSGTKYERKSLETTSPRGEKRTELDVSLDDGKIDQAYKTLQSMSSSPNGGHSDEGNALLGKFIVGTHKAAFKAFKAGDKNEAARLAGLVLITTPIVDGKGTNDDRICFDGKATCKRFFLTDAKSKYFTLLTDLAFFLEASGDAKNAAPILEQLAELNPQHTPVWLNLGDAQVKLNQTDAARVSYTKYAELRRASKREVPTRVAKFLEAKPTNEPPSDVAKKPETTPAEAPVKEATPAKAPKASGCQSVASPLGAGSFAAFTLIALVTLRPRRK